MPSDQLRKRIYYWESKNNSGSFYAISDEEAKMRLVGIKDLEILYKESDTDDGTPFIEIKIDGNNSIREDINPIPEE